MKTKRRTALLILLSAVFLTRCATIVGGSKYYAHVLVNGSPNAEIIYQGQNMGRGGATFRVNRNHANRFSLVIRERGCEEQTFNYHSRIFRGWALVGTLLGWTGVSSGVPIPWGLAVDLATGALWKPDVMEKGVSKYSNKNFGYLITYTGCATNQPEKKYDFPVDVVYLKNGSMIKGTIIEQDPALHVKLQTADGSIFVFKIDEIQKITRE